MRFGYLRLFIIIELILLLGSNPAQAHDNFCQLASNQINAMVSEKISLIGKMHERAPEKNITFFIGLYSKVMIQDRTQISKAISHSDSEVMAQELLKVHLKLASHLRRDKVSFKEWLLRNGLDQQVEVLSIPQNNYFILFKTSVETIPKILCAAMAGELPQIFADPGY